MTDVQGLLVLEAAGVDQVKARPKAEAAWLASAPTPRRATRGVVETAGVEHEIGG